MFSRDNSNNQSSNFWISYADLMAGLLFVFILLIGAIIVKSTILKTTLQNREMTLKKQSTDIEKKSEAITIRDEEINKLKNLLAQREQYIYESDKKLIISENTIKLKEKEISKLNQMLLAQNLKINKFSDKIVVLKNLADEYNSTIENEKATLNDYKNRVLIMSNELSKNSEKLKLSDDKLLKVLQALDDKQTKYDELLAKLQARKAKIKSLTGIKLKIIAELKSALGKNINIDKKSGSLRLSSNILFDKGSAILKEGAKAELKSNFIKYVDALISNKDIFSHIDKIIIEGHTDSDGGYLYNLGLSQKRAYAVMNYLLSLDYIKKHNIKTKLVASGRSYLDPIKVDGVEDKDASRRIEIKFRLKNEDAMYEIERILDAD